MRRQHVEKRGAFLQRVARIATLVLLHALLACSADPSSAQGLSLAAGVKIEVQTDRELSFAAKRGSSAVQIELEELSPAPDDARIGRLRIDPVDQRPAYVYMLLDRHGFPISSGGVSAVHPGLWETRLQRPVHRTKDELRSDLTLALAAIDVLQASSATDPRHREELVHLRRTAKELLELPAP